MTKSEIRDIQICLLSIIFEVASSRDQHVSPFLAWGDFHAHLRFARSAIPEKKWESTRSLWPSAHVSSLIYKSNLSRGWGEGFLGTKAAHRDLQSFVSLSKGKWRKKNWSRIFLHMNPPGLANNVFIFFLLVKKASNPHMYVFWCSGRLIAKTKTKFYNIF